MFYKKALALLILTVTMVTKSAVAQGSKRCPEDSLAFGSEFSGAFTAETCPIANRRDYGMCCLRGDPHITTFDRYHYNLDASGYFLAVGLCFGGTFDGEVVVYIKPRKIDPMQFRVIGVRLTKEGRTYEFTFERNKPKLFTVDGVVQNFDPPNSPYFDTHLVAFFNPGNHREFIVRCFDVRISINCKFHSVYIWVRKTHLYTGICGLCGTYNEDETDDTNCVDNCPDEDCTGNNPGCDAEEFGALWMTDDDGGSGGGTV